MSTLYFDFSKKLVIGIAGKKACGKNTLATLLQKKAEAIGLKVMQYAFGDPVKDEVSRAYGIPRELTTTQEGKLSQVSFTMEKDDPRLPQGNDVSIEDRDEHTCKCTTSVRTLLQWYGTNYRRKQDNDYWVSKTRDMINGLLEDYDIVIINDLRFPNEFGLINSYMRHYHCRLHPYPGYPYANDTHPSETALDNIHGFDDEWHPKYGVFHLKLIANKIYKDVLRPFCIDLRGEDAELNKVTEY